jgi:hypothetical protein
LPAFLDPGLALVQWLARQPDRVRLEPVGASTALDATLAINAVDCTRFVFCGHFPESHDLTPLQLLDWPALCYVRGDSLQAFLAEVQQVLGQDAGQWQVVLTANLRYGRLQQRFELPADAEQDTGQDDGLGSGQTASAAVLDVLAAAARGEPAHRHRFTATVWRRDGGLPRSRRSR